MQNPITKKSQQGFTLIELLIVVAIIGILAAIAIPQYAQYRTSAMNSGANSEVKNLQTALEGFYTTQGYSYPDASGEVALNNAGDIGGTNIPGFEFEPSNEVHIFYENTGGNQTYGMCGYHEGGDLEYAVNSSMSTIIERGCDSTDAGTCTGCAVPGGGSHTH